MNCKNPCGEISLGVSWPVMPWVQVQMMLSFGMIKPEEAEETLKQLEEEVVPDIIVDNGC